MRAIPVTDDLRKAFYSVASEAIRRKIVDHKDWDFMIDAFLAGSGVNCSVNVTLGPTDALLARALLGLENDDATLKAMHDQEHKWEKGERCG